MIRTIAVFAAMAVFSLGCATPTKTSKQSQKKAKQSKMIGKTKKRFNPDDYSLTDDKNLDEGHLKKGEAALVSPALDSPDSPY